MLLLRLPSGRILNWMRPGSLHCHHTRCRLCCAGARPAALRLHPRPPAVAPSPSAAGGLAALETPIRRRFAKRPLPGPALAAVPNRLVMARALRLAARSRSLSPVNEKSLFPETPRRCHFLNKKPGTSFRFCSHKLPSSWVEQSRAWGTGSARLPLDFIERLSGGRSCRGRGREDRGSLSGGRGRRLG